MDISTPQNSQMNDALRTSSRKTREQLNDIEKMRTRRINAEILSLRTLLEASNVQTKKDKFSILSSAFDFVCSLKDKINELEGELGGPDVINSYLSGNFANGGQEPLHKQEVVNYENLFKDAAVPMALILLDGVFVHVNAALCSISGYTRGEFSTMNLFHLFPTDEMESIFIVIGNMLTRPFQSIRYEKKRCRFRTHEEHGMLIFWLTMSDNGEPENILVLFNIVDNDLTLPPSLPPNDVHMRVRSDMRSDAKLIPRNAHIPLSTATATAASNVSTVGYSLGSTGKCNIGVHAAAAGNSLLAAASSVSVGAGTGSVSGSCNAIGKGSKSAIGGNNSAAAAVTVTGGYSGYHFGPSGLQSQSLPFGGRNYSCNDNDNNNSNSSGSSANVDYSRSETGRPSSGLVWNPSPQMDHHRMHMHTTHSLPMGWGGLGTGMAAAGSTGVPSTCGGLGTYRHAADMQWAGHL